MEVISLTWREMPKKNIDNSAKERLFGTISKLKGPNEVKQFLGDLLSSSEVKDLARRLLAAEYLFDGKTYEMVREDLGMGMATINKVHFKTKGSKILYNLLT